MVIEVFLLKIKILKELETMAFPKHELLGTGSQIMDSPMKKKLGF